MGKIAVYGAAFNPITYAHLLTAEIVATRRNLDKVIFEPSSNTRSDKDVTLIDNEHRYNMVKLATEDNEKFEVSRVEIDANGWMNYTVDTMRYYRKKYPNDEIYFLLGADNLAQLSKWSKGVELIVENKFIIMARDGYDMLEIIAKDPWLRKYEQEKFDLIHKGIQMDISSTFIRDEISVGGSAKYLLPEICLDYIKEHGLYK